MTEVFTVDDLILAMRALEDAPRRPHVHIVNPAYQDRRLALRSEDVDVLVPCGDCGAVVGLTKPVGLLR